MLSEGKNPHNFITNEISQIRKETIPRGVACLAFGRPRVQYIALQIKQTCGGKRERETRHRSSTENT